MYINSFSAEERLLVIDYLLKNLKIQKSSLGHWMYGHRNPSPKHALQIEKLTIGAVTRYDLRPDIYQRDG